MFTVFMHNDDFTTMEFVVMILVNVFFKTENEAERLMLEIHIRKSGCGHIYFRHSRVESKKSHRNGQGQKDSLCA